MLQRSSFTEPSLIVLLGSNLLTLIFAIIYSWPVGQLLWIYWIQSVTIGVINVIRIAITKNLKIDASMKVNGRRVHNPSRWMLGSFFALHFGIFHLGYFVFLIVLYSSEINLLSTLLFGLLFVFAHVFSFFMNFEEDEKVPTSIGKLMGFPYIRVFPMHISIILGAIMGSSLALIIFMSLKTLADVAMHIVDHYSSKNKKKNVHMH